MQAKPQAVSRIQIERRATIAARHPPASFIASAARLRLPCPPLSPHIASTPAELFPQRAVIPWPATSTSLNCGSARSTRTRSPGCQSAQHPSIDHHGRAVMRPRHDQFVHPVGRIDHGPIGQRMRADRRDHERLQILPQDRSAGRKAVGRRADRRADDQTVATIGSYQFCVNVEMDIENRERPRRREWPFRSAQAASATLLPVAANHRAFEHQMLDHAKLAAQNRRQNVDQLVGRTDRPENPAFPNCRQARATADSPSDWRPAGSPHRRPSTTAISASVAERSLYSPRSDEHDVGMLFDDGPEPARVRCSTSSGLP